MRIRAALLSIVILTGVLAGSVDPPQALLTIEADKAWAVVIGISNYSSDDVEPLQYAASDAQAVADFLLSPRGGGLRPERVTTLLEGDATADAVRIQLASLGD